MYKLIPMSLLGVALTGGLALAAATDAGVRPITPGAIPDIGSGTSQPDAAIIRVATKDAAFSQWIARFRGRALAAGISPAVFDNSFANVHYNPEVIEKDRNQVEFKSKIWDYMDNATSSERVNKGRAAASQNSRALNSIEKHYGVDKDTVVAVWGMETKYGEKRGTTPVIDALATLSFDGRRGAFFEKQLIAALKILQSGDTTPANMIGSWAGAMGHTQFIPTSYLAYAVDFTGDGRRDIWSDDPTDALASTAAYLKRSGWRKGQPAVVEVRVPGGVSAGGKRSPSQWAQMGVVGMDGNPVRDYGTARILQLAGPSGPSFMVFPNFDVIKRYNNSDWYALAVGQLSNEVGGKPAVQAQWPRGYDPLNFEERQQVQELLKRKGYPLEKIDGIIGPSTIEMIKSYQQSIGVKPDGYASKTLLKQLKSR